MDEAERYEDHPPVDWAHFAARVPIGTRVKRMTREVLIEAITLETWPCNFEERLFEIGDGWSVRGLRDRLEARPVLYCQPFNRIEPLLFPVHYSEYWIDDQWLTFDQVMVLDIGEALNG